MNQGRSACRRTGQGRERPRRATARGWTARQGAESGPQSSEGTTSATFSTLFPGLLSLLAIVQAHSSPEGSQRAGGSCPQGKCNSEGAGGAACERAPWCGVAVTSVNVYLGWPRLLSLGVEEREGWGTAVHSQEAGLGVRLGVRLGYACWSVPPPYSLQPSPPLPAGGWGIRGQTPEQVTLSHPDRWPRPSGAQGSSFSSGCPG